MEIEKQGTDLLKQHRGIGRGLIDPERVRGRPGFEVIAKMR